MDNCIPAAYATDTASIIVIDDNRLSTRKLALAMSALGHNVQTAFDGVSALELIQRRRFDIILLDIEMPEMNGYDVLRVLKADAEQRDIPVIVISALEGDTGSVARALELGAEDFLPKDFDISILKARLKSSLVKKRLRDRELEYLRDVESLTKAAETIEAGAFRPADLDLGDVTERQDQLGRFATVFRDLSQAIYDRERRADRRVRTLWGILLVMAAGILTGIEPSLNRMATRLGANPLGLAIWCNVVGATVCLSIVALRGGMPRLHFGHIRFFLLWALVSGCFSKVWLAVISEHVPATQIALIASTRAFMVFCFAALVSVERPNLRRVFGLGLGFSAVTVVLLSRGANPGSASHVWLIASLGLPALLTVNTLLTAWRPRQIDSFATVGIMLLIATVFLIPVAAATDQLRLPDPVFGELMLIILALGTVNSIAVVLALDLVARTGAVFASQISYAQTFAGIAWGILILNETLSPLAWAALTPVILGFILVQPKHANEEFSVRISVDPPRIG